MNIGIDIDDTINNLHDILIIKGTEFNKKQKILFEINSDKWNWDEAFGWDEKTAHKFLTENIEESYLNAKIKDNAKDIINKLHEEGNKIFIITSRSKIHCKNPYEISEKWLKKHGILYDKLITDAMDKAKACRENNIDVFIDDHVDFCKDVSKEKIKVLMFNSPYNQNETKYKRVNNWIEVYENIKNKI